MNYIFIFRGSKALAPELLSSSGCCHFQYVGILSKWVLERNALLISFLRSHQVSHGCHEDHSFKAVSTFAICCFGSLQMIQEYQLSIEENHNFISWWKDFSFSQKGEQIMRKEAKLLK
jgi:hypothetical protein